MMKRLTQWTENGASLILDNPQNAEEARKQVTERFKLACNKLAALEDKIEQGTLIELPCKVGDKFYQVVKGLPVYEWEVETITFSNIYFPKNYVITARRSKDLAFWKFGSEDFGVTIFFTRGEAEKRLKELQE